MKNLENLFTVEDNHFLINKKFRGKVVGTTVISRDILRFQLDVAFFYLVQLNHLITELSRPDLIEENSETLFKIKTLKSVCEREWKIKIKERKENEK